VSTIDFYDAESVVFGMGSNPFGGYEYFWMSIVRHNVFLSR